MNGSANQATGRGRLRSVLMKLGLLLFGTVIAVGAAEIALRLMVVQETKRLATFDAELGWRGRPHGRGVYVRSAHGIRAPFRYNNLGFRDEDVVAKPNGGRRILVLGDSFVEGLEVEYADLFHERLEGQLSKNTSQPTDVAIIGSQGYSTAQQLRAFRKFHKRIQPDLVLLAFYSGNDFEDNLRRRFAYLENDQLRIPEESRSAWRLSYLGWQRWVYESSHCVFLMKNVYETATKRRFADESKTAVEVDANYKFEITEQLMRLLRHEVERSGAKFAVVIIPSRDEVNSQDFGMTKRCRELCERNQIPFLSLREHLTLSDYFATDIHLNSQGHALVADQLAEFVGVRWGESSDSAGAAKLSLSRE